MAKTPIKAHIISSIQGETGFTADKSKSANIIETLLEIIKRTLKPEEDALIFQAFF